MLFNLVILHQVKCLTRLLNSHHLFVTIISNSSTSSSRAEVTVVRVIYSLHDSILMRERERERERCVICVDSTGSKHGMLLPSMKQKNMKLLFKKCISHVHLKMSYIQECGF